VKYFIAGTDTGVGKTVFTGLFARHLLEIGKTVVVQKWVQTGSGEIPEDIETHFKLMKKDRESFLQENKLDLELLCPYNFSFPASPHLAARKEGVEIDSEKIVSAYKVLENRFEYILVEGSGGVLVPYSEKNTLLDIVDELRLPVILVVGNKLGAINHTLLTIEALRQRGLVVKALVFSNIFSNQDKEVLADNIDIIQKFSKIELIRKFECFGDSQPEFLRDKGFWTCFL
jgi:dethiobiotin synthetase